MDLFWRLGSVFCPPLTGWPPYMPPSVAPWCRRMETGSGPGRRTPSTRRYSEALRSPRTPRRASYEPRSRGPSDLKRSECFGFKSQVLWGIMLMIKSSSLKYWYKIDESRRHCWSHIQRWNEIDFLGDVLQNTYLLCCLFSYERKIRNQKGKKGINLMKYQ